MMQLEGAKAKSKTLVRIYWETAEIVRESVQVDGIATVSNDDQPVTLAGGKLVAANATSTRPTGMSNTNTRNKNNIIIRLAKEEDRRRGPRIIARTLHEKTVFSYIPWSDKKFDRMCDEIIKLPPNKVGLVAELSGPNGNQVLGFAFLTCGEYFAGEGHIVTTVQTIAVDTRNFMPTTIIQTFTRLIKGAKKWAETRVKKGEQATVVINVTTGVNLKGTDELLRLAGARCVGGGYVV